MKMTKDELAVILDAHGKWWRSEPGGKRAYLQGADLRGAYLRDADLRDADLQDADLRGADLRGAYLRGADLQGADIWPLAVKARSLRIDMAQLTAWEACDTGKAWVTATFGDTVSYLDCLLHGKDDYADWLYSRVLHMLMHPHDKPQGDEDEH
jgi:hypothetical protein